MLPPSVEILCDTRWIDERDKGSHLLRGLSRRLLGHGREAFAAVACGAHRAHGAAFQAVDLAAGLPRAEGCARGHG